MSWSILLPSLKVAEVINSVFGVTLTWATYQNHPVASPLLQAPANIHNTPGTVLGINFFMKKSYSTYNLALSSLSNKKSYHSFPLTKTQVCISNSNKNWDLSCFVGCKICKHIQRCMGVSVCRVAIQLQWSMGNPHIESKRCFEN